MPEEPKTGELDLSNLDSLLNDIEKDLPPEMLESIKSSAVATPDSAPTSIKPEQKAERQDCEPEVPHDELVASPVRPHEKDDPADDFQDMFTDEEEPDILPAEAVEAKLPPPRPRIVDDAPAAPPPAMEVQVPNATGMSSVQPPKAEPPVADTTFEDALELEAETKSPPAEPEDMAFAEALELEEPAAVATPVTAPIAAPAPPTAPLPQPLPPRAVTLEEFRKALADKKYDLAAQIGESIRPTQPSAAFRMNWAGALFYAGRPQDAERELIALLQQYPYHVAARRNLDIVRAGNSQAA